MDWLAFVTNIVNKVPIERVFFPPRDNSKALEEFAKTLTPSVGQKEAPSRQKTTTATQTVEKTAKAQPPTAPERPGLSTEETIAYQNREIGKQLLAMESHYAQRMRIAGTPCDCGATKHLLFLEELCQETIPMVSEPSTYEEIVRWVREAEPKSTEAAAKSGRHDDEYLIFSGQARDFRKRITRTLSLSALIEPKELKTALTPRP